MRRRTISAAAMEAWRAIDDPLEAAQEELRRAFHQVTALRCEVAVAQHSECPLMALENKHLQPVSDILVAVHELIAIHVPRYGAK
jgi:hypothetical protein